MNRSAYMFGLHGRETAHSVACFFLIKKKSLYLQSCANLATKPHLTFCLCLFHGTKQSTKQCCNSVGRHRLGGWCSWPISSISPCACVFFPNFDGRGSQSRTGKSRWPSIQRGAYFGICALHRIRKLLRGCRVLTMGAIREDF